VAAEDVDVRRHVAQVAGVGNELAEQVGGAQRALRVRRHLERVDEHVQHAGVALGARLYERALERRDDLRGIRPRGRLTAREVPELPRRPVHQRLGEERGHVEILREALVDAAHRRRVRVVPRCAVPGRRALRIACLQRLDQGPLDRGGVRGELERAPGGAVRLCDRPLHVHGVERLPRLVVVRP
jgi:hypothetical protein